MEGLRQLDEMNAIRHKLPERGTRVVVSHPIKPPLRDLSPLELDTLQLVLNLEEVGAVLDKSAVSDLDTARALVKLLTAGYARVA